MGMRSEASQQNFDKRLRVILQKTGAVAEAEIERCSGLSRKENKPLSTVLVQGDLVRESDLLGLLAREARIPPVDLGKVEVDTDVLDSVPQNVAKDYGIFPISKVGDVLTVAVSNPFDIVGLDDLRILTGGELRLVLSTEDAIHRAVDKAYNADAKAMTEIFEGTIDPNLEFSDEDLNAENINFADLTAEGSPVVKLVNLVIFKAIKDRASDIHIEPYEKKLRIRYRQDGILSEAFSPPKKMHNAILSRIKILSNLDIAERAKPQDGKFQIRVEGRQVDFRISVLPTIHGEKCVMRILDAENLALSLDLLGFEPQALENFRKAIHQPYGMLLVTGPTGSGKSTTLYSAVKEIYSIESNMVTVEDPVEYQIDGVNQVHVNPKRGLTFASALRSILRQDPNVILIGEIRDAETLEIAVKAALTGHLVLTTLHTNDASSTVTRMVDMGLDPFMVASSVLLITAQRLARKLCEHCKEPMDLPPRERLTRMGFFESEIDSPDGFTIFKAVGCPRCVQGYRGRFAIMETLVLNDDLKRLVVGGKPAIEVKKRALEQGMVTLRRAGLLNALRGRTTIEEVLRVTMED
ncbi:MAG: Flp pilus assembly complex ATPase component TadA [Planctomycetes bacterium]|nr:Flp pilus assembly complex ATPase component TadA [Planctomycetota bacterium]MBI3846828.1 Flp pilus assembly complex ATPase component TadA [Planctomycetota bacterium]